MGFNLYNLGVIRECWLDGGVLHYKSPITDKVSKCMTSLNVSCEKQQNIFYSKSVAFVLYTNDSMYIGRYDGKISVYRKSDMLLTGIQNWEVPMHPPTVCCGYYCEGGMPYEVFLDRSDLTTLYCGYHNIEAALVNGGRGVSFDLSYAAAMSEKRRGESPGYIYVEGGVRCATECRTVQDALWRRDCPVYL